jgi:hypothetical protein
MLLNASRDDVRQFMIAEMNAIQKQRYPKTVEAREEAEKKRRRRAQQPAPPALVPEFERAEHLSAARRSQYNSHVAIYGPKCVARCE